MSDREKTRLVHAARAEMAGDVGTVNPPVVRCSTSILLTGFDRVDQANS